jgi:hypothetical protein
MTKVQMRNFMKLYIQQNKYSLLHAYTNTLHYMWDIWNTSGSSPITEKNRCLALVTAVSCPSNGKGSPQLNCKPLQGNSEAPMKQVFLLSH